MCVRSRCMIAREMHIENPIVFTDMAYLVRICAQYSAGNLFGTR